jgi:hypothetical protein
MADKKPIEYVHVVEDATGKSIHVVKCDKSPAERVAAGMSINLDHNRFSLSISESPTEP